MNKSKLNFQKSFLKAKWQIVITLLFAFLLICCYVSVYINPTDFWLLAIPGLSFPILIFFNILLLIYWIIKRNLIALIPVFAILLNVSRLPDFIGLRKEINLASKTNPRAIKIMSWNVHHFQPRSGKSKTLTHSMLHVIDSIDPDILCLQEYYDQTNAKKNLTDSIKDITGCRYYYFRRVKNNYTGIITFSRYPIVNHGHIKDCAECLFTDIAINGKIKRFISVHLQSYFFPKRRDKLPPLAYIKRIEANLKTGLTKRGQQVVSLKQKMSQSQYPVSIIGDFNDTPNSYTFKQLSGGLVNTFRQKGSGYGRTYKTRLLPFQVDYILVSPDFKVNTQSIIPLVLSDHYPVVAEVSY